MIKQLFSGRQIAKVLLLAGFCTKLQFASGDNQAILPNDTAKSQIVLDTALAKGQLYDVGSTDDDHLIIVSSEDYPYSKGEILRWSIKSAKVVNRLPLSVLIDPADLSLVPNGKFLVADENKTDPSLPSVQSHRVTVIDSSTLRVVKTIDIGKENDISGLLIIPSDSKHIVVKLTSRVAVKNDFVYRNDRFEWLNIETGKIDKSLPYSQARGANSVQYSPDRKLLACLFQNDEDISDRLGIIDILDSETGKILWHIEGTEKQSVGYPLFFISPTRFISSDTVFDIKTKTAHQWAVINPSRRFVAEVPGHSAYAMFLTDKGTELRNWKTDRLVKSWPSLKEQGRLSFSPDLKIMAYKREQIVQFWKFDPAWLK